MCLVSNGDTDYWHFESFTCLLFLTFS
uniref:Uncharacterized protein n=1 Tax=Arundo donax TaxID=35708 RepID=A0A0A9BPD9_ARUDO